MPQCLAGFGIGVRGRDGQLDFRPGTGRAPHGEFSADEHPLRLGVAGQVRNILSKPGAKDRTHAAMIAFKRGIIEF